MSFKDRKKVKEPPPVTEVKDTPVIEEQPEEKPVEEKIPVVSNEVEPEEIEPLVKKERKQREQKEVNNLAIVGDTIAARDFRAICKKKGLQINTTLDEMLNSWNMVNYNL